MSLDILEELERYNDEFRPTQDMPNVESLEDGNYDFEIVSAVFDRTPKTRDLIVRSVLRINGGPLNGSVIERLWFLDKLANAERFGGDLKTLGFDVDQWKAPARPFNQELVKALPRLAGMKFRARKSTRKDSEKTYHNLNILGPIKSGASSGPPPAQVAPRPAAPATTPAPQPALAGAGRGDDAPPF